MERGFPGGGCIRWIRNGAGNDGRHGRRPGHGHALRDDGPGRFGHAWDGLRHDGGVAPVPEQLSGLTPEQAQKLSQLQQEAVARNSSRAQQRWVAQDKLNLLQMNEKRDWNAIRAASQKLFDLQRQQHDAAIDLQQKMDGLLTDSQRQEMARSWRGYGWMGVQ